MPEWIPITDSERVIAIAYDTTNEMIYVRFPDDVQYWYAGCPPHIWEEFTAPGTSKGRYIHHTLNGHPKGRYSG